MKDDRQLNDQPPATEAAVPPSTSAREAAVELAQQLGSAGVDVTLEAITGDLVGSPDLPGVGFTVLPRLPER